jgi:hypothetical protein
MPLGCAVEVVVETGACAQPFAGLDRPGSGLERDADAAVAARRDQPADADALRAGAGHAVYGGRLIQDDREKRRAGRREEADLHDAADPHLAHVARRGRRRAARDPDEGAGQTSDVVVDQRQDTVGNGVRVGHDPRELATNVAAARREPQRAQVSRDYPIGAVDRGDTATPEIARRVVGQVDESRARPVEDRGTRNACHAQSEQSGC